MAEIPSFINQEDITVVCSNCGLVKNEDGEWVEAIVDKNKLLSHGLCPKCLEEQMAILDKMVMFKDIEIGGKFVHPFFGPMEKKGLNTASNDKEPIIFVKPDFFVERA